MKVFVVSSGEYSDWGIVGIFSTLEKAAEYRDRVKVYDDSYGGVNDEIDEYELDAVKSPEMVEVILWDGSDDISMDAATEYKEPSFVQGSYRPYWRVIVNYQPDKERMIKAARDLVTAYKARNAGV